MTYIVNRYFMKKVILSFFLVATIVTASLATKHVVTVANFQFSPVTTTNVFVGDTIRWVWVSGSHTTTCNQNFDPSTFHPAGAADWSNPMNSGSTSFEYKVTKAGAYGFVCLPHSPSMGGNFIASTVTPVKLSSFLLSGSKEKVFLKWKTENEVNVDYYAVRRSENGSEFTEIATIPAKGNTASSESYDFADIKISSTRKYYYYSLALVDKDGQRTYSETRLFKNNEATAKIILSLSPNPIKSPGHLNMTFNAEKDGKMDVKLLNSEGKLIITTSMQAYTGVNKGHVHIGEQPAGVYTLVCTLNGVKETHILSYE